MILNMRKNKLIQSKIRMLVRAFAVLLSSCSDETVTSSGEKSGEKTCVTKTIPLTCETLSQEWQYESSSCGWKAACDPNRIAAINAIPDRELRIIPCEEMKFFMRTLENSSSICLVSNPNRNKFEGCDNETDYLIPIWDSHSLSFSMPVRGAISGIIVTIIGRSLNSDAESEKGAILDINGTIQKTVRTKPFESCQPATVTFSEEELLNADVSSLSDNGDLKFTLIGAKNSDFFVCKFEVKICS